MRELSGRETMWMIQTQHLAPYYGIARTRAGLLQQLRERQIDWRSGKKQGWQTVRVTVSKADAT